MKLREEAIKRSVQPEDIALETLREKFTNKRFHDADFLIGTMSEKDYPIFKAGIAPFETIDE
jgi:hypothetical protein